MPASATAVRDSVRALSSASPDASDDDTNKAVKTILNSRKCWRNMKGRAEAVWPPELEAALIEGLEKYRPAEAKSNRVLGRFPMRNKFVAEHIFETTGQRRTPKQVGSRIQQLRDTSSGKHILKAISDKHFEMMHPKSSDPDGHIAERSRSHKRALPQLTTLLPGLPSMVPLTHVYINTLPPDSAFYPSAAPLASIHVQDPRPLRAIDPTVSFTSPGQVSCQAVFQIYKASQFVQEEYAPMSISCGPLSEPGSSMPLFTYSMALVPQHWAFLCEVEDLSAYTIHLQVVHMLPAGPGGSSVLLSVLYHFVDASVSAATSAYAMSTCTPPLSPHPSSGELELDFSTISSGSSPSPLLDSVTLRTPPLLGTNGSIPLSNLPELMFSFDDGCSSIPSTPLDFPTVDSQMWGYIQSRSSSFSPSPSPLKTPLSTSMTCDPYLALEATALFDAFVYQ